MRPCPRISRPGCAASSLASAYRPTCWPKRTACRSIARIVSRCFSQEQPTASTWCAYPGSARASTAPSPSSSCTSWQTVARAAWPRRAPWSVLLPPALSASLAPQSTWRRWTPRAQTPRPRWHARQRARARPCAARKGRLRVPGDIAESFVVVLPHAVVARQLYEVLAVTLALTASCFRVRGAEDEVGRVGMLLDDLWHRLDDVFEALPGADQPESSEQVLLVQRALEVVGPAGHLHARHAMRDRVQLGRHDKRATRHALGQPVVLGQDQRRHVDHHHGRGAELVDLA